jgi:hypothetical protein
MTESMLAGEEIKLRKCTIIHMQYALPFKFPLRVTEDTWRCSGLSQFEPSVMIIVTLR